MEIVTYPAIFTPRDGQILVDFPDLPEAFTQGKTMEEALEFAKLGLAITINDKLGHFRWRKWLLHTRKRPFGKYGSTSTSISIKES